MRRTKSEVEQNEELALSHVTELARENTDLRRENARLLGWLKRWRDVFHSQFPYEELAAAIRGDAPPKRMAK